MALGGRDCYANTQCGDTSRRRNPRLDVDGIFDAFTGHGYCSQTSWFRRLQESFATQGDEKGTLHPNVAGHQVYGDRIYTKLALSLYPTGELRNPRAPEVPDTWAPHAPRDLQASHRGDPAWSRDNTIEINWSPASDNGPAQSGVAGYQTYFHFVASR